MTHLRTLLVASLPLGITAILLASACTLDDAFISEPGVFFCTQGSDCESGFKCQLGRCVDQNTPIPCTTEDQDKDGDGFGTRVDGERDTCQFRPLDQDDTCAECYPGAVEFCDGTWNSDPKDMPPTGEEEELTCNSEEDCAPVNSDIRSQVEILPDGTLEIFYAESIGGISRTKSRTFELKGSLPVGTRLTYRCLKPNGANAPGKCRPLPANVSSPECLQIGLSCSEGQYDATPITECMTNNPS